MNYTQFRNKVAGFSSNRQNLDNIPLLIEKANISILQVARDCVPLRLVKNSSSNRKILKRLDNRNYVCIPLEIKEDTLDIELDDSLLDAMALHMLAGIETARAPAYMKMYWNIIEAHEYAIMNDSLSTNYMILEDVVNNVDGIIVDNDDWSSILSGDTLDIDYKTIGGFNG